MRILIADTHRLFLESLIEYLTKADPNLIITGVYEHISLRQEMQEKPSDILIIDDKFPDSEDILQKNFREDCKMITLIPLDHHQRYLHAKDQNTITLPKTIPAKILLSCIYKLTQGQDVSFDLKLYDDHIYASAARKPLPSFDLTQREKQVLSFLAKGATNKDIARALDLQVVTVKLHVRSLCRKIGAKNRTQAALLAHENNLISS